MSLLNSIKHYTGMQFFLFRVATAICIFFIPLSMLDSFILTFYKIQCTDDLFNVLKAIYSLLLMTGFSRQIFSGIGWLLFPTLLPLLILTLVPSREPYLLLKRNNDPFILAKAIYYSSWLLLGIMIYLIVFLSQQLDLLIFAISIFLVHPSWFFKQNNHDGSNTSIIFFDGVCGLCNHWVNFCMQIDPYHLLHFAPIQGEKAQQMLPENYLRDLTTIVYYHDGNIYTKSTAVLNILSTLGGIWHVISWLRIIPAFIRNFIYNLTARSRYIIFGKRDTCRIPSPNERRFFYD